MTCLARNATRKNGNARSSFHVALLLFVTRVFFSTWCLSTGKGAMCAVNRSSIFFLLSIQIHMFDLVRRLYADTRAGLQRKPQRLIWNVLSVGIPFVLMGISYGGVFWIQRCILYGLLMVSSFLMTNCACHQLNVARTVRQARTINSTWRGMHFRAQWGSVPFDPFGALACALCRHRTKFFVRFSNMGTEWGGYHLHLPIESLLPSSSPLWATLMSLTILMGDAQFASLSSERTIVVRRGYFYFVAQRLLLFCVVTLLTFPLVNDVAKGSISFGAAHLRFCSAWFVTFLPLLFSLVSTKLLYIHLNFFATDNGLKWSDPSKRN